MKKFLGHPTGSLRGCILRAIEAYPEQNFTTRQLYEFMVMDFKVPTDSSTTNLTGFRSRNANMPRSTNSLSSILSQAARENVIKKTQPIGRKAAIWVKNSPNDICPECGRLFIEDHSCEEAFEND